MVGRHGCRHLECLVRRDVASFSALVAAHDRPRGSRRSAESSHPWSGVGTVNATPNSGRLSVVLKDRARADATASSLIDQASPRSSLRPIPKHLAFRFRVRAGHPDHRAVEPRAIPIYAERGPRQPRSSANGRAKLVTRTARIRLILRDVTSEAQDGGLRLYVDIDRQLAGRLGISVQNINDTLYDAFGQRQVSTIYGAVEPISRDSRGACPATRATPMRSTSSMSHRTPPIRRRARCRRTRRRRTLTCRRLRRTARRSSSARFRGSSTTTAPLSVQHISSSSRP